MSEQRHTGLLSVVGTPIGNLGDMAPRALEALRGADAVLCEDTRVTGRLMSAFDIHVRLERCDEHVIAARVSELVDRLCAGEHLAFVSDAGMPAVSDPGQCLVDAALTAGVRVEVVPGPSAVTCALVASGLSSDHFFFEGFLPRKKGEQRARLELLATIPGTIVVYESPKRVAATLAVLAEVMPDRQVALVRELTKLHEEVVRGAAAEVAAAVAARESVRGECVVVIGAPSQDRALAGEQVDDAALVELIAEGLRAGEAKSVLAKRLAKQYGFSRAQVYDRVVSLAQELES